MAKQSDDDVQSIRALIDRLADAVRRQDMAAIRADHAPDILMFDVPPPFMAQGLEAYMNTWQLFFSHAEKPVSFSFEDVEVTSGSDVAFATAKGKCVNIDTTGSREPLTFRFTMGLKKIDGRWWILHEHHSLPAID